MLWDFNRYRRTLPGRTYNIETAAHYFSEAVPGILYAYMLPAIINSLCGIKSCSGIRNRNDIMLIGFICTDSDRSSFPCPADAMLYGIFNHRLHRQRRHRK